jgi:amino acid transporter
MTTTDVSNLGWGLLLVLIGLLVVRRRRPPGRWDYRPLGALAVVVGAVGVALAMAAFVRLVTH